MPVRHISSVGTCQRMILGTLIIVFLLALMGSSRVALAQEKNEPAKASSNAELIARGKYIVQGIGACAYCHTPRDENGEPDRRRWLLGAPVFLQPSQSMPGWAIVAPRIAGLPPGMDSEIITLLTTGIWRNGQPPRQPMPRFHMTRSDAEAVLAYLKSLQ